jgi:hypothetical protein
MRAILRNRWSVIRPHGKKHPSPQEDKHKTAKVYPSHVIAQKDAGTASGEGKAITAKKNAKANAAINSAPTVVPIRKATANFSFMADYSLTWAADRMGLPPTQMMSLDAPSDLVFRDRVRLGCIRATWSKKSMGSTADSKLNTRLGLTVIPVSSNRPLKKTNPEMDRNRLR